MSAWAFIVHIIYRRSSNGMHLHWITSSSPFRCDGVMCDVLMFHRLFHAIFLDMCMTATKLRRLNSNFTFISKRSSERCKRANLTPRISVQFFLFIHFGKSTGSSHYIHRVANASKRNDTHTATSFSSDCLCQISCVSLSVLWRFVSSI